jgi:hypothetical protein
MYPINRDNKIFNPHKLFDVLTGNTSQYDQEITVMYKNLIFEHGNEILGSIKFEQFHDHIYDCRLLKNDCAPWSQTDFNRLCVGIKPVEATPTLQLIIFCLQEYQNCGGVNFQCEHRHLTYGSQFVCSNEY